MSGRSAQLDFDRDDLVLDYGLRRPLWSLGDPQALAEQWHVRAVVDDGESHALEVATADVVRVDVDRVLAAGATPYEVLDEHSADLEVIAAAAFDVRTGELRHDLEDSLVRPEAGVLILDRVWVAPAYRGHEIGPLVAACALDTLRLGCGVALCYPSPFESCPAPGPALAAAVAQLGRVWAKVGFEPYANGVHALDFGTMALSTSLEHLARARQPA